MSPALRTQVLRRISAGAQRGLNRILQAAIITALLAGIRRRNPSVITNGVVSFVFAVMPRYLENQYKVRFRPWQRLWVSAAALVHTLGILGPYDRIWWWDHLTHVLSGIVIAGGADVVVRAERQKAGESSVSPRFRAAFIAGMTLAFGVLWELLEYVVHTVANREGFEPPLVHYSRLDTVEDVIFDLLAAEIVILFGRQALSNVVEAVTDSD